MTITETVPEATTTDGWVGEICVDCAMFHANNDTSGMDEDTFTRVVQGATGYRIVVGGDAGFSWQWCDACDSPLGGDRCNAVFLVV